MMDPQQELYTYIRQAAVQEFGEEVVKDGLPLDDVPYPIVYLDDTTMTDQTYKDRILADVSVRIHAYHLAEKRGTLSSMLLTLKRICRTDDTSHYRWLIRDITQNIIDDDTTGVRLKHGVLDVSYKLLGGS